MIINITEPITLLLITLFTGLMIFLGKETKKSWIPGIILGVYLVLLVLFVIQFITLGPNEENLIPTLGFCMGIDFVLILVSYIGYLWVDDIETKEFGRKSIDNSLDWLWKQV